MAVSEPRRRGRSKYSQAESMRAVRNNRQLLCAMNKVRQQCRPESGSVTDLALALCAIHKTAVQVLAAVGVMDEPEEDVS